MRKLGRIVRRVLTAVSLLLFVAVLVAWVRGYWSWDNLKVMMPLRINDRDFAGLRWTVGWSNGQLSIARYRWHYSDSAATGTIRLEAEMRENRDLISYYQQFRVQGTSRSWGPHAGAWYGWQLKMGDPVTLEISFLVFPCWMAAIVFGVLPSWRGFVWWRGVRRRRLASREGRCPVCGYDLRASPGRCPECGTAVEARETPGGGAV